MSVNCSSKLVFLPPKLGKPDPTQDRPRIGEDNRKRVIQSGTKDNT